MGQHDTPRFPICLKPFQRDEAPALFEIFFKAVRDGTCEHYDRAQRYAWAPYRRMPAAWPDRLDRQYSIVARLQGRIVGFMTLDEDGYLDLAYVHPDHKGCGIGTKLYQDIEAEALHKGLHVLTTEASHLARPFFARHGWDEVEKQKIERHGVTLENFRMEKVLD